MSPQRSPESRRFSLDRCLRAPVRRQTYRNLVYLLVIFLLGNAYFILLSTGIVVGISLAIVLVGILILLFVPVVVVGIAGFERALIRVLVDVDVASPKSVDSDTGLGDRFTQLLTDRWTWTAFVYLASEFVYGSIVFGLLASVGVTAGSFLLAPLYYQRAPVVAYGPFSLGRQTLDLMFGWDTLLVGLTTTIRIGSWQIETLPGALAVAGGGAVLLFLLFQLSNIFAWVWVQYARFMLQTPRYWPPIEWDALTPW